MKYLKQLLIILAFSLAGEALQALIPLPIPAAIYGIVLLLIALCTGVLKAQAISDTAHFLIGIMPLLFVAPAVNILKNWGVIFSDGAKKQLITAQEARTMLSAGQRPAPGARLTPLAKEIFEKYGNEGNLNSKLIDTTQIQKYYRGKKHWFYDLNGLMQQLAGEDAKEFTNALNQAVVYKATTPAFLETSINSAKFSGLSTYIPSPRADAELLAYYRKLLWNKDTGYISAE